MMTVVFLKKIRSYMNCACWYTEEFSSRHVVYMASYLSASREVVLNQKIATSLGGHMSDILHVKYLYYDL